MITADYISTFNPQFINGEYLVYSNRYIAELMQDTMAFHGALVSGAVQ